MQNITVEQLAAAIAANFVGQGDLEITSAAEPQSAKPDQIAIATSPAYTSKLAIGGAQVALLAEDADWQGLGLKAAILVKRPRFSMSALTRHLDPLWRMQTGVHATAVIDPSAKIGPGASIGAFTVIGANVVVGNNACIGSHVSIRQDCKLGDDATLFDGVKIGHGVTIGHRFIAHPGAVIGADGFSFVTPEVSAVEHVRDTLGDTKDAKAQSYVRIHSLGGVHIGDDVELGANSCIDRGTIRETTIGNGCKFDNLAQIGHNVQIGNDCLICAQVGIAGSSRIGNNVILGGQTGISDNVFVGDNAITGGATKVLANVPAGRVMLGYPAMKMQTHLEIYKSLRRLPQALKDVAKLKTSIPKSDESA